MPLLPLALLLAVAFAAATSAFVRPGWSVSQQGHHISSASQSAEQPAHSQGLNVVEEALVVAAAAAAAAAAGGTGTAAAPVALLLLLLSSIPLKLGDPRPPNECAGERAAPLVLLLLEEEEEEEDNKND